MIILQSWDCFSLALIWSEAEPASTHMLSISVCASAELRREVPVQIPAAVSYEHSHRTQAVYVPVVWQRLQHETVFRWAHEDTHRWGAQTFKTCGEWIKIDCLFWTYFVGNFTMIMIILIYSGSPQNVGTLNELMPLCYITNQINFAVH